MLEPKKPKPSEGLWLFHTVKNRGRQGESSRGEPTVLGAMVPGCRTHPMDLPRHKPRYCLARPQASRTHGRSHVGTVLALSWGGGGKTNKQICRAEEQRPGRVFPINLALPEEKSKTPCYECQRYYIFCRKEGGKEGRTKS